MTGFMKLLEQGPETLIVLDLRPDAQSAPLPATSALVLLVTPNQVMKILDRLPSTQSVVFCGAQASWIATIQRSPSMEGSAPLYFLDDGFSRLEAA